MSDPDEFLTNRQLLELSIRIFDMQVIPKLDKILKAMGQAGMIELESITENDL